jgi:hypothetical protein
MPILALTSEEMSHGLLSGVESSGINHNRIPQKTVTSPHHSHERLESSKNHDKNRER